MSEASYGSGLGNTAFTFGTLTNTPQNNVKSGAAVLHGIEIDAINNPGESGSVNLFNSAAPVAGTTAPTLWFPYIAGAKYTVMITGDDSDGFNFATALSINATQENCNNEGAGSSTAPSGIVNVNLLAG